MNMYRFFMMQMKLIFKDPLKLLILLAIPVTAVLLSRFSDEEEAAVMRAAYYIEGDGQELSVIRELLDKEEGMFCFTETRDEEELLKMVAAEKAECGFVIPASFFEDMRKGKTKGIIDVISSPATTLSGTAAESLYARLYPEVAKRRMGDYLTAESDIADCAPGIFDEEDVYEIYERIFAGGSTFSFDYSGGKEHAAPSKKGMALAPLKGLLAVFILLSGMTGLMSFVRYSANPVYDRKGVRVVLCLAPMLPALIMSMLAYIFIADIPGVDRSGAGLLAEFGKLVIYVFLCLILLFVLGSFSWSRKLLPALIPVYILCSLVFSPVFIDAGSISPLLYKISFLFAPTWYLL